MSVNFFIGKCQTSTNEELFGICDDNSQPWAYIDIADNTKWIAIVKNNKKIQTKFIAIDKCLSIKKANGDLESTCDGMLTHYDTIIFIELKERLVKNSIWTKEGSEQLKNTINIFERNHNGSVYHKRNAYLVNRLKPNFASTQIVRMQKFKDETNYNLIIQQEIIIS